LTREQQAQSENPIVANFFQSISSPQGARAGRKEIGEQTITAPRSLSSSLGNKTGTKEKGRLLLDTPVLPFAKKPVPAAYSSDEAASNAHVDSSDDSSNGKSGEPPAKKTAYYVDSSDDDSSNGAGKNLRKQKLPLITQIIILTI
jgi:hypothetical protein